MSQLCEAIDVVENQTASSENESAIGGHKRRMRPGGESEERLPDNESRIASFGCPPCCASLQPQLVANFAPYLVRAKP